MTLHSSITIVRVEKFTSIEIRCCVVYGVYIKRLILFLRPPFRGDTAALQKNLFNFYESKLFVPQGGSKILIDDTFFFHYKLLCQWQ